MIETILMITIAIAITTILFFLRNGLKLLINAICGVITLFIVSYFNLAPIGNLTIAQIVVCTTSGMVGAAFLIILAFFGIVI